jgi:hypothetical protein
LRLYNMPISGPFTVRTVEDGFGFSQCSAWSARRVHEGNVSLSGT